jgi:hypothetical protein
MNKWIFAILAIALASCGTQRQIKKCEKCFELLDTSKVVITDTVFIKQDTITKYIELPADTTITIVEIHCDSTGKATIKNTNKTKGNRSDLSLQLNDNRLIAVSTCDKLLDSIQSLNTTITKERSKTSTVFVPKLVEAKLTWWQKVKIRFGGWAFLLIGLYLSYKALKTYYKVNTPMGLILTLRRKLLR